MADTRDLPATVDITPRMKNSPVVETVKTFIQRLYTEYPPDERPSGHDIDRLMAFMKAHRRPVIDALREIITDDAVILVTGKLVSDRDRYIGTSRRKVL